MKQTLFYNKYVFPIVGDCSLFLMAPVPRISSASREGRDYPQGLFLAVLSDLCRHRGSNEGVLLNFFPRSPSLNESLKALPAFVSSSDLSSWLLIFFTSAPKPVYFLNLFLVVLGLHFCTQAFSDFGEQGLLSIVLHGFLTAVAFPVAEHRL